MTSVGVPGLAQQPLALNSHTIEGEKTQATHDFAGGVQEVRMKQKIGTVNDNSLISFPQSWQATEPSRPHPSAWAINSFFLDT